MSQTLRVLQIVPGTSVDGPGLRTSVYLAGCSHHCPGCHNPTSWDFNAGTEMSPEQVADIVLAHGFNLTLTGGDPLQHQSLPALERLLQSVKAEGLTVWCYTGHIYEEIISRPDLQPILNLIDYIVDGPFIESLRNVELSFRGSSNQRIIDRQGRVHTEFDHLTP